MFGGGGERGERGGGSRRSKEGEGGLVISVCGGSGD